MWFDYGERLPWDIDEAPVGRIGSAYVKNVSRTFTIFAIAICTQLRWYDRLLVYLHEVLHLLYYNCPEWHEFVDLACPPWPCGTYLDDKILQNIREKIKLRMARSTLQPGGDVCK
jgi:hypothetical protein